MSIGCRPPLARGRHAQAFVLISALGLVTSLGVAASASAATLRVMATGLGSGTISSRPVGISCGGTCDASFNGSVTLTATPAEDSKFSGWLGDCSSFNTAPTCTLMVTTSQSVRAEFEPKVAIPVMTDLRADKIGEFLEINTDVNTAARFIAALPDKGFKSNWIFMTRSESLQVGTAETPRLLLPSADAQYVFTFATAPNVKHPSYPGSHPNAIEYMQWDPDEKNFRFHEIVVAPIPATEAVPPRSRGVSEDEPRCFQCHSTQNVRNRSGLPGTTPPGPAGPLPPGTLAWKRWKSKPNWDTYDSWGGMLAFNRDRLYKDSVESKAFQAILNPWTWRTNSATRAIVEQLQLQPAGDTSITRANGSPDDGGVTLKTDDNSGSRPKTTNYSFDRKKGTGDGDSVNSGGDFLTLHHSAIPGSDEGRAVHLFDLLGGFAMENTNFNQKRIADELIKHEFATGSVRINVVPVALAITKGCLALNPAGDAVIVQNSSRTLKIDLGFFDSRHGMTLKQLVADTKSREVSFPRRKADIQKLNLDRRGDAYLIEPVDGLFHKYGGADPSADLIQQLRQEVFRRPIEPELGFNPDQTEEMGGVYVDREGYDHTNQVALYRYFLEPLGVSVDKWSMGVRGRSRTYTFADPPVYARYISTLTEDLQASMPTLSSCDQLIDAVNDTLLSTSTNPAERKLPAADAPVFYTDVQRIFNRSCIECHGGLNYPPYSVFPAYSLNLSEEEQPAAGRRRMTRSWEQANSLTSRILDRVTMKTEGCPFGMMPCGGPPLSNSDIETIRRWIIGGAKYSEGDPHLKTIDGTNYDFQGAGEFVLMRDEALEIQTRQSPVETETPLGPDPHSGLSSCVSLNTAIAIRVGGQRITYEPNLNGVPDPTGLQLRVDGKLMQVGAGIALRRGGRIRATQAPGGIQIETPGGTDIVITPNFWVFKQLWYMNINVRHGRGTEGLMGAISPGNWLPALPDGTLLGARPESLNERFAHLYQVFADAWRVNDSNTLFDYAAGTSTDTFTSRDWPFFQPETCRLEEGGPVMPPLPLATARQQCSALVDAVRRANCEKDVMITGEVGFATTYARTERIQDNRIPTAPSLLSPQDDAIDVGSTLSFTWTRATDPDGDPLSYRHCVWLVDQTLTAGQCRLLAGEATSTTVSGLLPGKAYYWKVIVEDRNNGTAESRMRRFATRATNTWAVGVAYKLGDRVLFNGLEYVCIQAHRSQVDWQPDRVPALWNRVIVGIPWQPQTAYATGAMVTFNGRSYECIQGHTSQVGWEPPKVPALWRAR